MLLSTLSLTAQAHEGRHLIAGSEIDYPPFASMEATGEPTGFSVELLRAIAAEVHIEVEFRVAPWAEVRAAFERRQLDLLPNMGINDERRRHAAFSVPHTVMHGAVFTRENAPRSSRPRRCALDLGKIELGAVHLEFEACDVRAEIDQMLRLFRPACDRRGVALTSAIADGVPAWLWLPSQQVRQILVNLVGNAVKFTAQGSAR